MFTTDISIDLDKETSEDISEGWSHSNYFITYKPTNTVRDHKEIIAEVRFFAHEQLLKSVLEDAEKKKVARDILATRHLPKWFQFLEDLLKQNNKSVMDEFKEWDKDAIPEKTIWTLPDLTSCERLNNFCRSIKKEIK